MRRSPETIITEFCLKQRFRRISGDGNGGGHAGDKVNTGPRSCGKIHGCETGGMVLYTAVDYAVSEKLFNGTSATTFAPNEAMTRGMFVTVLGNKAKFHSLSETFLI